jgi:hypothetical protein
MIRVGLILFCLLRATAAATEAAPPAEKIPVHVLPLAFSAESEKNYGAWIRTMQAQGVGNAVWSELEEILYDHPRYTVLQSPVTQQEFSDLIAARNRAEAAAPAGELYALPDRVLTINLNVFPRTSEQLKGFSTRKKTEFSVTVYLRYFDLTSGPLNRAIPAQADATAELPVEATRQAVGAALVKLLQRIDQAEGPRP